MLFIYLRQYLYFCTSKAITFVPVKQVAPRMLYIYLRHFLYFCTSKASKLSTSKLSAARPLGSTIYWKLLSNHLFFFWQYLLEALIEPHDIFVAETGALYRTPPPLFFGGAVYWKRLSNQLCFMLNKLYII